MFTTDEIFARLMNGESMDAIAAEMTKALNEAKAKAEEENKKKAEAEEKAKKEAVINEAAERAANAINELIGVMCPEFVDDTEQITPQMLKDMVESSYTLVKEVEKAFPMFEKLNIGGITKCKDKPKRSKVATLDDLCEEDVDAIIESFCNGFKF